MTTDPNFHFYLALFLFIASIGMAIYAVTKPAVEHYTRQLSHTMDLPNKHSLSDLSIKRLVALELIKLQKELGFAEDDPFLINMYQDYFNKISTWGDEETIRNGTII